MKFPIKFYFTLFFFLLNTGMIFAQGKKKVDLDDLMIKGELHSDGRLQILSRQKEDMKNYVKFRTNYRAEILQDRWVRNKIKKAK